MNRKQPLDPRPRFNRFAIPRRWILGIALSLTCAVASAQSAEAEPREFDAFSTSNGLIHNYVKTFYEDDEGFLWIGTMGGVSRFDGLRFDNFPLRNQVGSDEVLALFRARDGAFRVMTPSGFARFDGVDFAAEPVNVALANTELKKVLEDRMSRIWVGTRHGVYLISDWTAPEPTAVAPLSGWNVTVLFEDHRGGIWIGSRHAGLAHLPPGTTDAWQILDASSGLPHLIVNDVIEDASNTIWVATHQGVAFLEEGRFRPAPFQDALPHPIIFQLHWDRQQRLWMRTSLAGLVVWDGHHLDHYTQADGLAHNNTVAMLEDRSGRLWFASNQGLSLFDHGAFTVFDATNGLTTPSVTSLFEDRQGILWIGTAQGFCRFESHRLKTFLTDTSKTVIPPLSRVYSIFSDSHHHLWFPSYRGLGFFGPDGFRLFDPRDGLPGQEIHAIMEDDRHRVWVGTPQGPAVMDNGQWRAIDDPLLEAANIAQMVQDRDGYVWFLTGDYRIISLHADLDMPASEERLADAADPIREMYVDDRGFAWFFSASSAFCIRDGNVEQLQFSQIGAGTIVFDQVFNPDGTVWLGTNRGLVAYGRQNIQVITEDQGLPGTYVRRMFRALDGTLWLALTKANLQNLGREEPVGVAKFDGLTFDLFDQSRGLLSNAILTMVDFRDGGLWFLHQNGITRMVDGQWSTYGISQGLAGNRPTRVVQDESQDFWIATAGGLNKFRDGLLATYSEADGLLDAGITDLCLDRKDHLWIRTRRGVQRYVEKVSIPRVKLEHLSNGETDFPVTQDRAFRRQDGPLVIHYRGISISRGAEKVQFLYSLSDAHEQWIGPTRDTKVTLPLHNMRPGAYTFSVKAFSPDLYPTAEPATFRFTILPPIWLTPWFLILTIGSAIALGTILYRRRIRESLEQGRILHQIQVAREMQMSLMPQKPPEIDGWDIASYCRPAREVGGDYFDFFWLDAEHTQLGVAVVDVSGKSMEAAIIAVMTSGLLHGAITSRQNPEAILSALNETLYRKTPKNAFTTAFLTAIDLPTGTMDFANAGQIQPMLLRSGRVTRLTVPGLRVPLAALAHVTYESEHLQLLPGDLLLLYTDGLCEAMNDERQMFGHDRIEHILTTKADVSCEQVVQTILRDMDQFTEGRSPHDDITLVAIRFERAADTAGTTTPREWQ